MLLPSLTITGWDLLLGSLKGSSAAQATLKLPTSFRLSGQRPAALAHTHTHTFELESANIIQDSAFGKSGRLETREAPIRAPWLQNSGTNGSDSVRFGHNASRHINFRHKWLTCTWPVLPSLAERCRFNPVTVHT